MRKALLILLCISMIVLCSCKAENGYNAIDITTQNLKGNSNGNILCAGRLATQDGMVYYAGNKLYRIEKSSGEAQKIADGAFSNLNAINEYIYCTQKSGDHSYICRVNISNGETVKLADDDVVSMIAVNGWIYFSSRSENAICKMTIDGANRKRLYDSFAWNIGFENGYIYFVAEDSQYYLHKIDANGKGHWILNNNETLLSDVSGGYVYYSCKLNNDEAALCKIGTTDSDTSVLLNFAPLHINVYANNIYYITQDGLFRIDGDGNNKLELFSGNADCVYIADDWIYYVINTQDASGLYRIRPDGTKNELFFKDEDHA